MNETSPKIRFITGARRTGTTLLNQILCSDPRANAQIGECRPLAQILKAYAWTRDNFGHLGKWYFKDHAELLEFYRRMVTGFIDTAHGNLKRPEFMVLKAPDLAPMLGPLARMLPEAKFLVCVRHPLDQIASEVETQKRRQSAPGGENVPPADVVSLARQYTQRYQNLVEVVGRVGAQAMFVRFEDLVADVASVTARLAQFTGMDLSRYDPAAPWQRFDNAEDIRRMPAYVPQYGSPLDATRVGRYRDTLSPGNVGFIERECAKVMALLGYPPSGNTRARQ